MNSASNLRMETITLFAPLLVRDDHFNVSDIESWKQMCNLTLFMGVSLHIIKFASQEAGALHPLHKSPHSTQRATNRPLLWLFLASPVINSKQESKAACG